MGIPKLHDSIDWLIMNAKIQPPISPSTKRLHFRLKQALIFRKINCFEVAVR
ncbi:MAG: hypothetical protein ACJAS3_002231 [Roseivirga sp.]|jgi:hypothetical protein